MDRWFTQTVADLARHEGFRPHAYPDPLSEIHKKYPPAKYGWGYRPAADILKELGLDYNLGKPWTQGYGDTHNVSMTAAISEKDARVGLSRELSEHLPVLASLVPEWEVYPDFAKTVLANLAYNMGNRLAQFKNTLKYFRERNWAQAAAGLEKSLWYRQVGFRGEELVWRLRHEMIQAKYLVRTPQEEST